MLVASNLNIKEKSPLTAPVDIFIELPMTEKIAEVVMEGRTALREVLHGTDKKRRLIAIVGPCSIHNPKEALEYGEKLKKLQDELGDRLLILMRSYFEKPRTTVGWKGLLYDPHLNGSYNFEAGIRTARKLLMDLSAMGIYCATELLDPIITQYIADVISWAAIGARTTESQPHREFVSGLSMPTGFKNATNGDIQVAIDAVNTAKYEHSFLGVLGNGQTGVFRTTGNPDCHIILRGGNKSPNYTQDWIAFVTEKLKMSKLPANIIVDCSHANSYKDPQKQLVVVEDIARQIESGNTSIVGIMLESNIEAGSQTVVNLQDLKPGVSITDACISWDDTQSALLRLYDSLADRFKKEIHHI